MKRNKILILPIVIIFIFSIFYIWQFFLSTPSPINDFSTEGINLPSNYTFENFKIVERVGPKCDYNSDCNLPSNYAIQSNCPYQSVCMQNTCTVICPQQK